LGCPSDNTVVGITRLNANNTTVSQIEIAINFFINSYLIMLKV